MSPIGCCIVLANFLLLSLATPVTSQNKTELVNKIQDFKVHLHRTLEAAKVRRKRTLQASPPHQNEQMRLGSSAPADLPFLADYELTFWTSIRHGDENQVLIGTTEGHLFLYSYLADNGNPDVIASALNEDLGIKAKGFSYFDRQWFAVLHSASNQTWIRVYKRIGSGLERLQIIELNGETDFEIVSVRGVAYMALTTFGSSTGDGFTYQSNVVLYQWTRTQFDKIAYRIVYGARSVACWVLDGSLYLAVAQLVDDAGNANVGSPLLLYNSKEQDKLVLLDVLRTSGPKKVVHFQAGQSSYILFTGHQDAVIYWWSSNQFLMWQTIPGTAHASDAAILSLANGEVIIVIVLTEEALFLTMDASGQYKVSFIMTFSSALSALQFIFSGDAYYTLALFRASSRPHPEQLWKLTLDPYLLPTRSAFDPLERCLSTISEVLDVRQTELNAINVDLSRVWMDNKNQNVTAKVVITGSVSSPNSISTKEVIIVTEIKVIPEYSFAKVNENVMALVGVTDEVQHHLGGVVLKSTDQTIAGIKTFDGTLTIPSIAMDSTTYDVILNGVPLSQAAKRALKITGNQAFSGNLQISGIRAHDLQVELLNGISTDDLLLLKGEQRTKGRLSFSSLHGSDVIVQEGATVNSLLLDELVTTRSNQKITELKTFSRVHFDSIDVKDRTNGIYWDEIEQNLIRIDGEEMKGRFVFKSPLVIAGEVFLTGLVNNAIDLNELAIESVTKKSEQTITGPLEFKSDLTINGRLDATGLINQIDLNRLVTSTTDQVIQGNIEIHSLLAIDGNLDVDTVNQLDLDVAAVLRKSPEQFVQGLKSFSRSIEADFVDMTEHVVLDGVDPSQLFQEVTTHNQGVVGNNQTRFPSVSVLGNLTVVGGINGYKVFDLPQVVMLKSKPQLIASPLHIKGTLSALNDVEANSVNSLHLDTDVVHTFGDEVITSPKHFDNIRTQNLNTKGKKSVNGIDFESLKIDLEKQKNVKNGTVHGMKTLRRVEIRGNVLSENMDILSNVMLMDTQQTIEEPAEFSTVVMSNVKSTDLNFHKLNGSKVGGYLTSVLANSSKLVNKFFTDLRADGLVLHPNGRIDGVLLQDLLQRAVTLNTEQHIPVGKTFDSPVHFSGVVMAENVNDMNLNSIAEGVVLHDIAEMITGVKHFTGKITFGNVFVHGSVNAVKIEDVAENVFYKSRDNEITESFTFKEIDIGNLATGDTVDGISWGDLIFLKRDETLDSAWFVTNVQVDRDVYITGRLNGCDLTELGNHVLYTTNKSHQAINGPLSLGRLQVFGNVNIIRNVNGMSLDNIKEHVVTSTGNQNVSADIFMNMGTSVANLHLNGILEVDVALILKDAVRLSVPQVITGHKIFYEDLKAAVISGDFFVHGKVNGAVIDDMFKTAVLKSAVQVVLGEKQLQSVSIENATVKGYLNGLKLPNDVVDTFSAEYIGQPVFFMDDLVLKSDLIAQDFVDSVDLEYLLGYRVSLNEPQSITSKMTFHNEIILRGETAIDGTANYLVLELVVKGGQPLPVEGHKIFANDLILGSLITENINEFDVQFLSSNILRSNINEIIDHWQIFTGYFHALGSLSASWINGIDLPQLAKKFYSIINNVISTFAFMKQLSLHVEQALTFQLATPKSKISEFAYFVVVQEMYMGSVTRILRGYDLRYKEPEFSHTLVLWTIQSQCAYSEECCHKDYSYWLRVKESGVVVTDKHSEEGKYYPILDPAEKLHQTFIWTNVTEVQPKWCGKSGEVQISSFEKSFNPFSVQSSLILSDLRTFRDYSLYVVAAYYYDTKAGEYGYTMVYAYDELNSEWSEYQFLSTFGVLSLDISTHVHRDNTVERLLALGTGIGTYPDSYSTVYHWNSTAQEFRLLQKIPSQYVTSTVWVRKEETLLLALAGVDNWPMSDVGCSDVISGGQIDIYVYDGLLRWIQSIPVSGVSSMVSFTIQGDTFLAAASRHLQTVFIFELRGFSGFTLKQSIFVEELRHVNSYWIDEDLYLAVASASGPSKILKAVSRGNPYFAVRPETTTNELGDEPSVTKISSC